MTHGIKTIIFPVSDLAKAKAVYQELLGAEPSMDAPYYVQFDVGGVEVGLDPRGHGQGQTGPVAYWHVDDIEAGVERLVAAGARVQREPKDVGGGRRIATVEDADGNVLGLLQPA